MNNITFFNHVTLVLFDKLYSAFPTPMDIDVKSVAMLAFPADVEDDETWGSLQASEYAIDFLQQEGFLTHKGTYVEGGTFLQARLTLKGLAILGSTPDSLEGKQPLISRIRKVLSGGAKEAVNETVKQLIQYTFAVTVAAAPVVVTALAK